MNIVDMIKEQQMGKKKTAEQVPPQAPMMGAPINMPQPTEKAQIVVLWDAPLQSLIMRFNSAKEAEGVYKELHVAWRNYKYSGGLVDNNNLFECKHDMFWSVLDLRHVVNINLVNHARRAAFVPV